MMFASQKKLSTIQSADRIGTKYFLALGCFVALFAPVRSGTTRTFKEVTDRTGLYITNNHWITVPTKKWLNRAGQDLQMPKVASYLIGHSDDAHVRKHGGKWTEYKIFPDADGTKQKGKKILQERLLTRSGLRKVHLTIVRTCTKDHDDQSSMEYTPLYRSVDGIDLLLITSLGNGKATALWETVWEEIPSKIELNETFVGRQNFAEEKIASIEEDGDAVYNKRTRTISEIKNIVGVRSKLKEVLKETFERKIIGLIWQQSKDNGGHNKSAADALEEEELNRLYSKHVQETFRSG